MGPVLTDLRPHHLRQGADKLRRGVAVSAEGLLVHHLAHREPQGRLQALGRGLSASGGTELDGGTHIGGFSTSRTSSSDPSAIFHRRG